MHDFVAEQNSWIEALSDVDVAEPLDANRPSTSDIGILRRIRASVPRRWMPIARRGFGEVSARLSPGLRYRLHRLVGLTAPEMGAVERDYPAWIDQFDRVDAQTRRTIMAGIARMSEPPVISVLMPVFNPRPDYLQAAIHSVQDQFYPWWELCIADDASTDPAVVEVLKDAAAGDHRIKLIQRERNGHISAASNSALDLATGPFVALLDHDDILPPHALYEIAARIAQQPDIDILYSDEDHIDEEGHRSHPYFKPDWNFELMMGQNLISHLGVYRRSLVERIGGFRTGFEGSQDYDLALRVVAETTSSRIVHIPRVLYHWRQGASDHTFSKGAHERCVQNGRRAVHSYVVQDQPGAAVEAAPLVSVFTRVVYPLPEPRPLVSVIVTGSSPTDALLRCIDSLLNRSDYGAIEILLPAAVGPHHADPRVRVIEGGRLSLNELAEAAHGSLLLFLDPALEAEEPGWLTEMVSHAVRPDVGAVGAKLVDAEGMILHAGMAVGGRGIAFAPLAGRSRTQAGYFGYLQLARDVTAVSGGCLMLRRQAYIEAGGLDETSLPPAFADLDLCLKLESAGLRNVWTPYAELYRRETPLPLGPDGATLARRGLALMRQRWGRRLYRDRYWSPNLSMGPREIALAFPPPDNGTPGLRAA